MKGKRVMAVALSAALLGTAAGVMAGCNNKGDKLIYWVFDRDMAQQVRDYYATEERNLGYEIEIETVPLESMLTRLDKRCVPEPIFRMSLHLRRKHSRSTSIRAHSSWNRSMSTKISLQICMTIR